MGESGRRTAGTLLLATLASFAAPQSQDEPARSDVREEVRVELVQFEVSVWPKGERADSTSCRELTADDFVVVVNGRERRIDAVDWLGSASAIEAIEGRPVEDPRRPPLSVVLLFDLWHLDLFFRDFDCPITKPLAFEEARRFVREEFREGDRLLLATLSGWPQVYEGWIRDAEHALRALDRLEVDPFVVSMNRTHQHHYGWFEGLRSLLLALGRYPGRKEVFYFGDDFRFDDLQLRVFDLAARAQSNGVAIHAVDLLATCRSVPGPGCAPMGGLACTPFRAPIALGYLAENTGGELMRTDSLTDSVRHVRELRGCRYLISFEARPRDRKRAPKATVRLMRKDLSVNYPSSFGHPGRAPTEREEQDALFLLPRFGHGLHAEVGLWPLRPDEKRKAWGGLAVGRLRRVPEDEWPEDVSKLRVETVVHKGSRVLGQYGVTIAGTELTALREGRTSRLFVFPVERIRPGAVTVAMRVIAEKTGVSANVRSVVQVPEPPGPGQSAAWFLTDRLARTGETTTLLPVLDGRLDGHKPALLVGYGCAGESAFGRGLLRSVDTEETRPVEVDWLDGETHANSGCGWLVGKIGDDVTAGLWRFEPPVDSGEESDEPLPIEFRIGVVASGPD